MGRRGWILIGIGVVVVVTAFAAVVIPRIGNVLAGADGIHDASALPRQIQLCGLRG